MKLRRRAWQEREVCSTSRRWAALAERRPLGPRGARADASCWRAIRDAIETVLTPHQRARLRRARAQRACRSTSSPSASAPPAARSTRRCTTPARKLRAALERRLTDDEPQRLDRCWARRREVGCDECFDQLDEYVELELAARTPTPRCRGCAPTSTAARPAARTTTPCATSFWPSPSPCPARRR